MFVLYIMLAVFWVTFAVFIQVNTKDALATCLGWTVFKVIPFWTGILFALLAYSSFYGH